LADWHPKEVQKMHGVFGITGNVSNVVPYCHFSGLATILLGMF